MIYKLNVNSFKFFNLTLNLNVLVTNPALKTIISLVISFEDSNKLCSYTISFIYNVQIYVHYINRYTIYLRHQEYKHFKRLLKSREIKKRTGNTKVDERPYIPMEMQNEI